MNGLTMSAIGRQTKTQRRFPRPVQMAALAIVLMAVSSPAFGSLIITPTFDATIAANFGANAAAFQNAWTMAAAQFSNAFTDNIHININVSSVAGTGTLGQSNTPIFSSSFSGMIAGAVADSTSADDATSVGVGGSLAGADPLGTAHTYWLTKAQRKALGLAADDLTSDGTTTFGAGFSYTFDGTAAAGKIDLVGVIEHEISEVMGRIGISGGLVNGTASYTLLDLLSYKSAGTRGMSNDGGNFFSINAGTTLLKAFNNQAGLGGDSRDWASGTNDAFNAFSSSGVVNGLSAVDFRLMDVLGYNNATIPEPSTGVLLMSALLAGCFVMRRRIRS